MLGDSLIKNGNWNSILNRLDIKNSGFGGFTTSHMVMILQTSVLAYQPRICFICCGINDIYVGIPKKRTEVNIKKIVDTLMSHNIKPIIQSVLFTDCIKVNDEVSDVNEILKKISIDNNIDYLDINRVISPNGKLDSCYSNDGIHVNKKAYSIWGKIINDFIVKNKI